MSGTTGDDAPYRFLTMTGPVDGLTMTPVAFTAEEGISVPFALHVDVVCDQPNLKPEQALYKPLCLTLNGEDGPVRHFHGLVRRLSALGPDVRGNWVYALDVAPKLWFLMQTSDCRVFTQKTTDAILTALFNDGGVSPVEFRLYGARRTRDYTAQMNETDLVFASRLMQEEGWYYFFEHEAGLHKLVISDQNTGFHALDPAKVDLNPGVSDADTLSTWCTTATTAYGQVCLRDYDPATPNASLEATKKTTDPVAGASARDVFRWPALTLAADEVDRRSHIMIEAAEAQAALVNGTGYNAAFQAGAKFTLKTDPQSGDADKQYVLRSVVHRGFEDVNRTSATDTAYSNSFSAFPATRQWRDAITIERPNMPGIFTATVIGPDGEEIHTDDMGRVMIRFPWDHRQDSKADSTIWVRVIHSWAGNGWGTQFIPRVGTEVAVAFIDGDIDRPIVVGGLYNGNDTPPFTLTGQKNKSGVRTRSTLKGGASNYSELSFDDTKGSELVTFQAEKNLKRKVKANETTSIGAAQTEEIGGDRSVTIDKGDDTLDLKQGSRSTRIEQGDDNLKLDMGNLSVDVAMGDVAIKADLGSVTVEAMNEITFKVGANTLTISQSGIAIKGMMISVESDLNTAVKGAMVDVSGSATVSVKAGVVMIN